MLISKDTKSLTNEEKNALRVSKDALTKDILQLKDSMEILHDLIKDQGEELNTIEDEIHTNKQLIIQGTEDVSLDTNYSSSIIAGIGAGIGTIILVLCML
jgi:ElaB/YqjD/DUF883 family membrane-anchored ribosome-binding protein